MSFSFLLSFCFIAYCQPYPTAGLFPFFSAMIFYSQQRRGRFLYVVCPRKGQGSKIHAIRAALWRAQSVRGLLTAGRCACPSGYSGLSGAISAGRGQAAAAPLSAPHKGRVERPLPLCYPHLCLARSYRAHASTSGEGLFN
ncbi:hypothetical protein ANACOL_03973 [Anaerotruncus colihominis DSM 17241]|uniref:Uncharacterized protein n=1 Tax=Anaerotruncus colihominis DSM 17241 TaxID=445972 RepID=B0PGV5_9FIRM|nr:hypothetical protein ANACOL_03973 [Anaerotruncus colihominis DSM 17241]